MSDSDYFEDDEDDETEDKKDKITWIRNPKWGKIFNVEFNKNFNIKDFEDIIKQFMKQFGIPKHKGPSDGPMVWGFSMSIGPDNKPRIKPFGNISPQGAKELQPAYRDDLYDIIEETDEVTIIAEILGVEMSDIKLKASKKNLKISIDTANQKYFNEIIFPCEVLPNTMQTCYQNGILEVKIKKKC
ncbi:MAG: Hsp20/alpha crystallin family protein [Candidatus Helarchaeota archaeon]